MNTDFISAAGSAARIPSRIGEEQEAVIGTTHPNGTALALDAGDMSESTLLNDVDGGGSTSAGSGATALRETYYNVGSAAVVVLLLAAVAAIFFCLRARVRKDSAGQLAPPYESNSTGSRKRRSAQHSRKSGSMSSSGRGSKRTSRDQYEEPHEVCLTHR